MNSAGRSQADVLLSAARALWEVPTPRLRAVALAWDDEWLRPRFVYEVKPSDDERGLVSPFGTYLIADFSEHRVEERVDAFGPSDRTGVTIALLD